MNPRHSEHRPCRAAHHLRSNQRNWRAAEAQEAVVERLPRPPSAPRPGPIIPQPPDQELAHCVVEVGGVVGAAGGLLPRIGQAPQPFAQIAARTAAIGETVQSPAQIQSLGDETLAGLRIALSRNIGLDGVEIGLRFGFDYDAVAPRRAALRRLRASARFAST